MSAKHVAVLMGGWSSEREVSLMSGRAVAAALRGRGYGVSEIDVDRDLGQRLAALAPPADVAFNALHGRFGEDGRVQGLLDIMGLPYTHSGVLASALAMDKPMAKRVFASAGIPCPHGEVVEVAEATHALAPPYVIKPVAEGSTVGVRVVHAGDNRPNLEAEAWTWGERVLVETYVPGRELTVAVLDGRPLGCLEIRPLGGFYDYEAKYREGRAEHLMPAPVPAHVSARALDYAATAHCVLGCRGVSRADFRYDDATDTLALLEVNTQPGMTPLSLVPEIAAHAGLDFEALVVHLVEEARCDA